MSNKTCVVGVALEGAFGSRWSSDPAREEPLGGEHDRETGRVTQQPG